MTAEAVLTASNQRGQGSRETPPSARLLGRLVEDRAAKYGSRQFLNFIGRQTISFLELDQNSNRFAHGLRNLGLAKGAKVAVMLPNCPEYLYLLVGAAKLGAITVPVNTAYRGDLLAHVLGNSDAEILVVHQDFVEQAREIAPGLPELRNVLLHSGDKNIRVSEFGTNVGVSHLGSFFEESAEKVEADIRHTDEVMILYTGGTTGPSKGVVMTHHFYYSYARMVASSIGYTEQDVSYTCMPLFHINAQVGSIISALYAGASVALYQRFSAHSFWDEIRSSGATVFLGMGAVGNILMKGAPSPADADNKVRLAVIVPPPTDIEGFEKRFGLRLVYETFGMTEGLFIPPRLLNPRRPGCAGIPIPEYQVRIADDNDAAVPVGEIGEILVRPRDPYTMMSGYYKMPEATLEAFRNLWFHTGDLGYLDESGALYYGGRKKDAIRRRGENISAFEVESVINQHPVVLESAAIAVPAELGEDDVKIVVVMRPGAEPDAEDIVRFAESRMAYFMVPRYVEFRESLPKNPSQRIEKYKLREAGNTAATWDREKSGVVLKR